MYPSDRKLTVIVTYLFIAIYYSIHHQQNKKVKAAVKMKMKKSNPKSGEYIYSCSYIVQ